MKIKFLNKFYLEMSNMIEKTFKNKELGIELTYYI